MAYQDDNNFGSGDGNAFKQFQLSTDTNAKQKPEFGKSIADDIAATVFSGISNGYFWLRNTRFWQNRQMSAGRQDSSKWMDRLQMNSKFNYLNINWQSLKIYNTIISKMVGRWMGRNEKIVVKAIDSLSLKDKQTEYEQAEFVMNNRKALEDLQIASGVQMIPKDQFTPDDTDELELWRAEYQRLPEEIAYELGCNDVLDSNGYYDVMKEKLCHDSATVGLVATMVEMDEKGLISVEWVKPENYFYSYSEYPDMRDTTWRGYVKSMKISELRRKYGKEFGGDLTEEELFNIASYAKEYQLYDKIRWLVEWNVAILRPYDEWNVDVMVYFVRSIDKAPYTIIKTKKFNTTLIKKGKPKKVSENEEYEEDEYQNMYKGVYIRYTKTMLEWGLYTNMIRPQDPKQSGSVEFPISSYMYQNNDMRNIAVPEKIQRPAEQMILTCFKIEQLMMVMRPVGAAVNLDALQELDYGLGDKNKTIDPQKLYDQTGMLYYRGKDAEGNPIPVPISELKNSGFLEQMQGLISLYQFHYQTLKDELGEDPNLMSQAAKPRVNEGNIQVSQQENANATDYMYDGVLYVLEQTATKISCLLKDSVTYGAEAYRHLVKDRDVKGRVFTTRMKALPQDEQIEAFKMYMNQALQSNPDLVKYLDPFKAERMAREDLKLGELYFRRCQKKMLISEAQIAQQNQQQTAQAQQQSNAQTAQNAMQLEQFKVQAESQKNSDLSKGKKEEIALQGLFAIWQAGVPVPPVLAGVQQEIVTNILLPLFAENQINKEKISQAMQLQQQQAQAEQQENSPQQPQGAQSQPDPNQQQQIQPSQQNAA